MKPETGDCFVADISEFEPWKGASGIVPSMPAAEFQKLKTDIRQKGILEPVAVVKPGEKFLVLDGLARIEAAEELGISSIPALLVPVPQEEYGLFVLARAAFRKHLTSGQRAVLAAELNDTLLPLKEKDSFLQIFKRLGITLPVSQKKRVRIQEIATGHFGVSTGYLASARKIRQHDPTVYSLLRQGRISMYEAKRCLSVSLEISGSSERGRHCNTPELIHALDSAHEKIRELEESRERIRNCLKVILPFAKRAVKGNSLHAKYRFVIRPAARNTLSGAVESGDELVRELKELKKHVADMEAENLLLSVRHDDPQQLTLVHTLCFLKSAFEVSSVHDSLEIMKTVPVLTQDVVDEFFRLLTRTINFSRAFVGQMDRISRSTPAHLDEQARTELQKYVDGKPAETAFEVPALRNTARQQLVIYTKEARRDHHNYQVPGGGKEK